MTTSLKKLISERENARMLLEDLEISLKRIAKRRENNCSLDNDEWYEAEFRSWKVKRILEINFLSRIIEQKIICEKYKYENSWAYFSNSPL